MMIQSTIDQIRRERPEALIVVRPTIYWQNPSYWISNDIGLLNLYNKKKGNSLYCRIVNFILRKTWMVMPSQVDLVLNCRGFFYSDVWIKDECMYHDELKYLSRFTNKKTKFILLPQAFGSFETEWPKKILDATYHRSSLIFARDNVSRSYLERLYPCSTKIMQAPDFTCLLSGEENSCVQIPNGLFVVVILNCRMIDKTEPEIANNYLPFFKSIVEHLTEQGEKVILLNHEGVEDEVLLHRLNEMLKVKLPVITRLSGVETKRVIASAKLLITSRFHGAVSGIMQGIPTLCTSWSHKYLELLKEMKSENNQLDVLDISSAISIIDMALSHPELFSASAQSRDIYCTCTQDMWSKVFSYLPE